MSIDRQLARPQEGRPDARSGAALGRSPALLIVPAVLAAALLVVPLVSLVLQTPWSDFFSELTSTAVLEALRLTAIASVSTVIACIALGRPLPWLLARVPFPGRSLMQALVLVPLVLPPVVGASRW